MALAGAIIRTRKERERKRNESAEKEDSLSEVIYGKDKERERESCDGDSSVDLRKSATSLKKTASKTELLRRSRKLLSQSFDSEVGGGGGDGIFESTQSYSGLILICMGSVITFVGLGDKVSMSEWNLNFEGFKTLELKLIGPVLCLFGLICVVFKILLCSFPRLFRTPRCFRGPKLMDSESKSNVNGGGTHNGHLINNATVKPNSNVFSPRVTLTSQSSIRTPRAQSTVPNFIEDSTDDDDDFSAARIGPPSTRPYLNSDKAVIDAYHLQYQHQLQLKQKLEQIQKERLEMEEKRKDEAQTSAGGQGMLKLKSNPSEIVLDPKALQI